MRRRIDRIDGPAGHGRPNRPSFAPAMKASHCRRSNTRTAPPGSLLSPIATRASPASGATHAVGGLAARTGTPGRAGEAVGAGWGGVSWSLHQGPPGCRTGPAGCRVAGGTLTHPGGPRRVARAVAAAAVRPVRWSTGRPHRPARSWCPPASAPPPAAVPSWSPPTSSPRRCSARSSRCATGATSGAAARRAARRGRPICRRRGLDARTGGRRRLPHGCGGGRGDAGTEDPARTVPTEMAG